jgi:thiol-disulfide isomerase/thioredoxin
MPDTNISFNDMKLLRNYVFNKMKSFDSFCEKRNQQHDKHIRLANHSAQIIFDDLQETIYFKYYKSASRNLQSIGMLGFFSPYSNIVSLSERINLYNSFPSEIRNSSIGKKTFQKFEEYGFKRNINLDIHQFETLPVKDENNNSIKINSIFDNHQYYIIVFGASWCLACRIEELQLKLWAPLIDSSMIKIVGLSIDTDPKKWKEYLDNDKLPWKCYLLNGGMENRMVKELMFEGVPRNFLLDNKGKILSENTDIRKILKDVPILETFK